jgi:hypothetical protein
VLQALANRANSADWTWPSQPTLASDTGLSVRSCQTWTHYLADRGLIAMELRGKLMHYRILMPPKDDEPLQPVQGSKSYKRSKDYQPTHEVHDKGYQPVQDVHGSGPRPVQDVHDDPCTPCISTHAPGASQNLTREPYKKPKTREDARRQVGFNSHLLKEAGTPPPEPEREPTPREIEARRREAQAAIDAAPSELARAVQRLGASMRGIAYAPGRSGISPGEQLETLQPRRPKAAPVTPEQLRAIRLLAARSPAHPPSLSLVSR